MERYSCLVGVQGHLYTCTYIHILSDRVNSVAVPCVRQSLLVYRADRTETMADLRSHPIL